MITDTKTNNLRVVLHQIWANLYVEFVVKNPLSPAEHSGGIGVANELFESGLASFMVGTLKLRGLTIFFLLILRVEHVFCVLKQQLLTGRGGNGPCSGAAWFRRTLLLVDLGHQAHDGQARRL